MYKKFFSLFLLGALLSTYFLTNAAERHNPTTHWQTMRLSDHDLSEGGLGKTMNLIGTTAGDTAHAAWMERIDEDNYELFYRQWPDHPIQQVGIVSPDLNFGLAPYLNLQIVSESNGRACLIYQLSVENEGTDLYLWCNDYVTPIHLSDNALTNDNVYARFLLMDSGNQAHVLWVEAAPGLDQRELFYWNEPTGTTRLLSNNNTSSYILTPDILLVGQTAHVVWSEYSEADLFTPYYWDSASDIVSDLSLPDQVYATNTELVQDSAGGIHLFWRADITGVGNACMIHWEEGQGAILSPLIDGCSSAYFEAATDNQAQVHAAWLGDSPGNTQDTLYYWNTTITATTIITGDVSNSGFSLWLTARPNGESNLLWTDEPFGSPNNDLFFWNSNSGQIKNLSDGIAGDVNNDSLVWDFSADGTIHAVWSEGNTNQHDIFYRDTQAAETLHLSGSQIITGDAELPAFTMMAGDVAQVGWIEETLANTPAIFQWQSDVMTTTQQVEMNPVPALPQFLWYSPIDTLQGVWTQPEYASPSDMIAWQTGEGPSNLSELAGTNGDVVLEYGSIQLHEGFNGRAFLLWAEETGTGEGVDVFGAWSTVSAPLDYHVYLPIIRR